MGRKGWLRPKKRVFARTWPRWQLDPGIPSLQNCEPEVSALHKPPSLWYLLWQPNWNQTLYINYASIFLSFLFFFFFNPPLTHLSCQAGTQTTLPGEQASKPSLLALNRTSEAMCSLLSVTIGWWSHCSSKNARLYFPLYRNAAMQLGRTVLCAHAQLSVVSNSLQPHRL